MRITVIAAITIDGFIGHSLNERLKLSSEADLAEVMKLRADCDAILIGAETIRKDDSTLITRDENLIEQRLQRGNCKDPIKVTLTRTGKISLQSNFIKYGECEKIVYTTNSIDTAIENELSKVVILKKFDNDNLTAKQIVEDLQQRGIETLIVEGGTQILTMFFQENLVNELRLSVVPFFVGDETAPRFTSSSKLFFDKDNRMKLEKIEQLGDTAVMTYKLKADTK
jgi:5-amino-6-(5-phosphoribosylamino)uracil reductase